MQRLRARYRYSAILLRELVRTDFKLRYQGSVLGYLWSLLRPLLLFVILYFVFAKFLKVGDSVPHYPVYLLLGIVLWNYFGEVTGGSVQSIVGRGDLLRKINFPKYVIILAGSFSALINLLLNFIVIGFFMAISGVRLTTEAFWILPLLAELFVFSIAVAFFLSALYVRFRDVSYIWEVSMQAAFYATPILYPLTKVPAHVGGLLLLNPMAQIIQDSRHALVTPTTQTIFNFWSAHAWVRAVPFLITVITAILAASYFRSRSKYFAEEV